MSGIDPVQGPVDLPGIRAMTYRTLLAASLMALSLAGCAKNRGAMSQNPGEFDTAKEPPINSNTHFAAGQLAESREQFDKAIFQYRAALQQCANNPLALFRLGYLYAQQKQYSQAIEIWTRYVKATDGSATAYGDLAFCEELAGDSKRAEADYLRGIEKDPKNETCRVNFGLMLARHNRMNEAVLQLQTVLTPAQVHYDLAGVYRKLGRNDLAKAEYQEAVDADPNFSDAKTKLAEINLTQ